jgi:hypothetical protein
MSIEDLLGQPVNGAPNYRYGEADEVRTDGDRRSVPIYRDGEEVGTASGVTGDELERSATRIAEDDERSSE